MDFIVSAVTDVGLHKETNQDSYSVRGFHTPQGKMVFAILCDGMGGFSCGEIASANVVNAFNQWIDANLPVISAAPIEDHFMRSEWTALANQCNQAVFNYAQERGIRMGTTITALLLTETRYYILNVGDTRCYQLTEELRVLTRDQSLVNREVELGNLTEEEARHDERRNVLLQCIGACDTVYPDVYFGDTVNNAVYMLCSDGFRHEISSEEIFSVLRPDSMRSEDEMKYNMTALIELNKQRMEQDNITVITIRSFGV